MGWGLWGSEEDVRALEPEVTSNCNHMMWGLRSELLIGEPSLQPHPWFQMVSRLRGICWFKCDVPQQALVFETLVPSWLCCLERTFRDCKRHRDYSLALLSAWDLCFLVGCQDVSQPQSHTSHNSHEPCRAFRLRNCELKYLLPLSRCQHQVFISAGKQHKANGQII